MVRESENAGVCPAGVQAFIADDLEGYGNIEHAGADDGGRQSLVFVSVS